MKITLKRLNKTKNIATGYSWKSLLFGVFYPLFIGDIKGFILQLPIAIITGGISWVFTPFHYNENRLTRLLKDGWELQNLNK